MIDIGKQFPSDDSFKTAARLHQSQYRANVLQLECNVYGSKLTEQDAIAHHNYYEGLNVRRARKKRYPNDSISRDGDMLRSEHIPFNILAPLRTNQTLAKHIIKIAFGLESDAPYKIKIEFAPKPKVKYLNDATSFDTFIRFTDQLGQKIGIGIEVKYTEKGYPIGETEKKNVADKESRYWKVTRESYAFLDDNNPLLQKKGSLRNLMGSFFNTTALNLFAYPASHSKTVFLPGSFRSYEILERRPLTSESYC